MVEDGRDLWRRTDPTPISINQSNFAIKLFIFTFKIIINSLVGIFFPRL